MGRNSKSVECKLGIARKKTKFKIKIRRGKKVKEGKRREEQNMRFEINYIIKSSDNMHKLQGQKINVKKLCRREKITNHEGDHSGIHFSSI